MQLGMVGLGRMGGNIVRRVMRFHHTSVVYDRNPDAVATLVGEGAVGASSLADMIAKMPKPRTVWVMLPAGEITDATITELSNLMAAGDIIIDGGNSFWKDDIRHGAMLKAKGISFVDVGTSGGVWGLERGYAMMIGGEKATVDYLDPIFSCMAPGAGTVPKTPHREGRDPRPENGYLHAGPCGAGHFVKMIHNGIEYGLMQAFAEGFDILKNANSPELPAEHRFDLNVPDIAESWRRGSVVSSWLLDLAAAGLAEDNNLESYSGFVQDSGEGRWTIEAAIAEAVPADVLSAALYARFRSRQTHTFAEKMLSAMRKGFGGHVEPKNVELKK